jgi:uncharacterized membrane protein YkoI
MKRTTKIITIVSAVAVAGLATGAAVAANLDDDEDQQPITGDALQRASDAALAYTGGGRVTETEVGDEESYYEVEVTLDDGSQVDVQLDEQFNVVGGEHDDDNGSDD